MKTTVYKRTRTGKIQQWSIWVEASGKSGHPEVWIEHGLTDGKKQTTHDIIKEGVNVGKANETTPLEQAKLILERKLTKQKEEGYKDTIKDAKEQQSISFTERLPKELCFYKPKNSISESKLKKLERDKKGISNTYKIVKRDGMMHIVRKTKKFGVEIYSRRIDLVTDKYPHLVESFDFLPNDSILLGEIVFVNKDGTDNFNIVSQICRSDPEKAIEKQNELGKVKYYPYDCAFYGGKNLLTSHTYGERFSILTVDDVMPNAGYLRKFSEHILPPERIHGPHDEALKEAKDRGLEGLVVWDANGKMKDGEAFTFNGKAYRPNVLWKSKPKFEDDFIVRFDPNNGVGEYGKGKNNGKIKSVFIYQLENDGEVFLGKCGGGLSDEQRDFYTTAEYPRVWRIEYDSIQQGTGSLRFPVFSADRTLIGDKSVKECIMSDEIKLARRKNDE